MLHVQREITCQKRLVFCDGQINFVLDQLELGVSKDWLNDMLLDDCTNPLIGDALEHLITCLFLRFHQSDLPTETCVVVCPFFETESDLFDSVAVGFAEESGIVLECGLSRLLAQHQHFHEICDVKILCGIFSKHGLTARRHRPQVPI